MFENIRLAFQGIWSHKMRSFLTMLGIIIGIASIISIVSTIRGTSEMLKQNLIFIVGKAQGVINLSRMVGDVGSLSAFDDKNVAGYQKLDSFPDGASSDVQHCGQLEFIWKFVFTCELTIYN